VLSASLQNAERSRLLHPHRKGGCLAFAGFDRDRGLAGVAGERVAGWVARAAVADLGQQLGRGDHAARVAEQRQEDLAIGVLAQRGRDLAVELLDLGDERPDRRDQREHERSAGAQLRRDQREHERSAGAQLRLADASLGCPSELREQRGGLLATRIPLARKERRQTLFAERTRVGWARVALQERERDQIWLSRSLNSPIGPGQNRSSSARSWSPSATLACTRSSRPRVSARSALV
jgi:hypothetical protein